LDRAAGARVAAVIVTQGEEQLVVLVDEVLHDAELVVRPLPWDVHGAPGIAGVALLPDGQLAMMLDVGHLFDARAKALQAAAEAATSEVAASKLAPSEASESIAPANSRLRVLVADDSTMARNLARVTLARAGYHVEIACDGAEAWERLASETFDLLVSDVDMPGLSGIELTRRVREDARLGRLPIVLVTSHSTDAVMSDGVAAGAGEYIVKGEHAMRTLLQALERLAKRDR
jgi:two-component system chemotaxis sensor kinase CheA